MRRRLHSVELPTASAPTEELPHRHPRREFSFVLREKRIQLFGPLLPEDEQRAFSHLAVNPLRVTPPSSRHCAPLICLCGTGPALSGTRFTSYPLIEGYGDELENDYQSRQIFSNHCLPETVAQPRPSP